MFTIEKGIPVHETRGLAFKYPFDEMDIGDSFFVADHVTHPSIVRRSAYQHGVRHGVKFITRTITENGVKGVRVWRIQ